MMFLATIIFTGSLFAPGDAAVAVPSGDTARQDALSCAPVNVCEGFS